MTYLYHFASLFYLLFLVLYLTNTNSLCRFVSYFISRGPILFGKTVSPVSVNQRVGQPVVIYVLCSPLLRRSYQLPSMESDALSYWNSYGTGSCPPSCDGLQRRIRLEAKSTPEKRPYRSIACMLKFEQEGLKRHCLDFMCRDK